MSERASGLKTPLEKLVAQSVCVGQYLNRMFRGSSGGLPNLQSRERTVGNDGVRLPGDRIEQGLPDLHRQRKELLLHAPGAVVPGAIFERLELRTGNELQQVAGLEPDVLHLQMTGEVICDASRASLEVERQLSFRVAAHQVLREVERGLRERAAIRVGVQKRILLLERQTAGRARSDDRVAGANEGKKPVDVDDPAFAGRVDVSTLEVRHSTAALRGNRHLAAVLLENGHSRAGRLRRVVVEVAGHEERHARERRASALGRTRRPASLFPPGQEALGSVARKQPIPVHAESLLHGNAGPAALVDRVDHRRGGRRHSADGVRRREDSLAKARFALVFDSRGPVSQDDSRNVDVPAMRRVIRTVRNAELALVAKVRETLQVSRLETLRMPVHVRPVERPEQNVERRAEVIAAAAALADVRYPPQLLLDRGERVKIVRRRIKHVASASSACSSYASMPHPSRLKLTEVFESLLEPAGVRLLRRARVSNHSATSAKPSSRARRAKPGY